MVTTKIRQRRASSLDLTDVYWQSRQNGLEPLVRLDGLLADSDHLTGPNGSQMLKAGWDQENEVFQKNASPAENNDRDLPIPDVLLIFKATIYG